MKSSVVLVLLSLSLSAFAGLDELLGDYKPTSGTGEATVTKELVREADLFNPAQYEYRVSLWKDHHSLGQDTALEISPDGKSLEASGGNECDDPGCYYFDMLDIKTSKPTPRSKPVIEVEYEGNHFSDGDSGDYDFSGTAKFIKK